MGASTAKSGWLESVRRALDSFNGCSLGRSKTRADAGCEPQTLIDWPDSPASGDVISRSTKSQPSREVQAQHQRYQVQGARTGRQASAPVLARYARNALACGSPRRICRRLHLTDEKLSALDNCNPKVPIRLKVSPFLPPELDGCVWALSELEIFKKLYDTKTSKVYHAQHRTSGRHVALKCYMKRNMYALQKVQAMREIWFHAHISHPSIVPMYAAWLESDRICIAVEYAHDGSVFRSLRRHSRTLEAVEAGQRIMQPVLSALLFMHELGLVHRDIKPENLLWAENGCKISDFGLVINHREEVANTCLGTFDYMAPELFRLPHKKHPMAYKRDSDARACDEKVDVWACGVLLYEVCYGRAPFAADTPKLTCENILRGFDGDFPQPGRNGGLCELGKDFVRQTLTFRAAERPSIADLLAHPWMCKCTEQPDSVAIMMRDDSIKIMARFGMLLEGDSESWTGILNSEDLSREQGAE